MPISAYDSNNLNINDGIISAIESSDYDRRCLIFTNTFLITTPTPIPLLVKTSLNANYILIKLCLLCCCPQQHSSECRRLPVDCSNGCGEVIPREEVRCYYSRKLFPSSEVDGNFKDFTYLLTYYGSRASISSSRRQRIKPWTKPIRFKRFIISYLIWMFQSTY